MDQMNENPQSQPNSSMHSEQTQDHTMHTSTQQTVPPHATPGFEQKDIEENKYLAAMSYLGFLLFVPLIAKRDSKFVMEHLKQGIAMWVTMMIALLVIWIPLVGWLIGLILAALNVVAFVKCLMGEFWEVPFIGEHRKKINL